MEISVRQMTIEPEYIGRLLTSGIVLVSHLNTFDPAGLSEKTKLKVTECEKILAATKPKRPYYFQKVSELMVKPFERIPTMISDLDSILGGGVKCGQITEISGVAGAGKSNLCCEMALLVMLPKKKRGMNGEVLFIHTEGMGKLKLCIKRFQTLAESINREYLIQTNLHVHNCENEFQLEEITNRLDEILNNKPTVKMIVVDSVACAFMTTDEKQDFDFYSRRTLRLTKVAKKLSQIAWDRRIAIVVTNHVTYDPKKGENKPALGKDWTHMCHTRIYLDRRGARYANVTKGAVNSPHPVKYEISATWNPPWACPVSDRIQS